MTTLYTKLSPLPGQHARGDRRAPQHQGITWDGANIGQVYTHSKETHRGFSRTWRAITPDGLNMYGGTVRRDAVRVLREHSLKLRDKDVTVYAMPEPPADLLEVWDAEGEHWSRKAGNEDWVADDGFGGLPETCTFAELLYNYGPLHTRKQEAS